MNVQEKHQESPINRELAQLLHKEDKFDLFLEDVRTAQFKAEIPDVTEMLKKISTARPRLDTEDVMLANARTEEAQDILEERLMTKDSLPWYTRFPWDPTPEAFNELQDVLAEVVWSWTVEGYENDMLDLWSRCKEEAK